MRLPFRRSGDDTTEQPEQEKPEDRAPDPNDETRGRQAERPGELKPRGWKDVLVRTMKEFKSDQVPILAAAAAFYAWLALLPAIIAAVSLYGLLASPDQVSQQITELTENLSQDVANVLRQPVEQATGSSGNGLTIGLIIAVAGALWSASGGMGGLIAGVSIAYDEEDDRNFFVKRGLALLLTLGAIVGFLIAVTLIAVVPPVIDVLGLGSLAALAVQIGRWVLLAILMVLGLAALYRWAPDRDNPKFKWVTPGAIVATLLWLVVSGLFSFYVSNFGSYNKTYGALAGVIILELWLYLSSLIILFGAELNAEAEAQTAKDTTVGSRKPMGERRAQKADELGATT